MIVFLSCALFIESVFIVFILYKLINLERNAYNAFLISKALEEEWLKIKRSFTPSQAATFIDQSCVRCKNVLPEGTLKAIDGHKYCASCKAKVAVDLQKLIDGFKTDEVVSPVN